VTGIVAELHESRGTGVIQGADGKMYAFRRYDLRDCWFHDLVVGSPVTFEARTGMRALDATEVRREPSTNA
jgi:cold shock CspA family protein